MKKPFTRILALSLLLLLLVGVLPAPAGASSVEEHTTDRPDSVYVFTEADNAVLEQDVFSDIQAVKADAAAKLGGAGHMTEQDYINLVPQVVEAIKRSDTYVPGTLQQNGYFLVWETTVGMPCCYDPRMEAELHNVDNEPTPEEIAEAEKQAQAILDDITPYKGGPTSVKIGLIQPYWESNSNYGDSSFCNYSPQYKALWQSLCATTGGEGMRYSMTNATVDNIASVMSECGMVMFDSHGTTDYSGGYQDYTSRANCSYLCLTTNAGVTSADTAPQTGEFGTYYHCIKGSDYAYVSGTCIANHMTEYAPNSYLYMGICLGMATDGMEAGLRAKGVEAVYGYSQSVSFVGDMDYMNTLNTALKNGDTLADAVAATKESVGLWDHYSSYPNISSAISNHCAFPIVASSEDPYPGHGNVDALQDVYSSWSLFGTNFAVEALSNNEAWGTVSVHGSAITAEPAEGYYAADYTILSGEATVTRNGNTFVVRATTDCSVQINFAAKTPVTVTYMANGAVYSSVPGYAGDALTLPTAVTEVENWTFKGWSLEPIEESLEKPTFYKPGAAFTPDADTTIYALYTRVQEGGGDELGYELLSEAPTNWEGNYVISYGTDSGMYLLKGLSGTSSGASIESGSNAVSFATSGATLDEETLIEVPTDYIFKMEAHGSNYSLQSLSTGAYYGMNGYSLCAYSSYNGTNCNWTPGVGANASCLYYTAGGSYPYFSFYESQHYFWAYNSLNTSVRLWAETELGTRVYSTNPGNMAHTHSMQHVEAKQPTCGDNGNIEYYHCVICGKCFEDEAGEHEIAQADTVLAATGEHQYGEWTSANNGTHKKTCSVCGTAQTEACTYDSAVTEPTCTEAGYTTFTCTVCAYSYQGNNVGALGHDWSEWARTQEPTCTAAGEEKHECARCHCAETRPVNALGHDYNGVVTEPTCTEGGYTTYTCTRCNDAYTADETDPLGHALSDWTVTTEPSCVTDGSESRSCARCEYSETRTVNALGHDWDEGVITKEPTEAEDGERVHTCTRCSETKTDVIPKLARPNPFEDVHYGRYYFDAVQWAYYHEPQITGGTDATHFSPNAPCTREQIVFFLWAAAGKPAPTQTETAFTDVKQNRYYYNAVLWAQEQGITSGVSETEFGVGKYCTRAQVVTFLWRAAGSQEPTEAVNPFQDVPADAYYAKAVLWAVENQISGGTAADAFSPKLFCTRAQVVTFLYRLDTLSVR